MAERLEFQAFSRHYAWQNPLILTILEEIFMAEEKVRFQIRINPVTDRKVKAAMP